MLLSVQPVYSQGCIDWQEIDKTLSELPDACGCNTTLQLGQPGQTTYLSSYQTGLWVQNECIEIAGTLVVDMVVIFDNCDIKMDDGALIKVNDWVEIITFRDCNIQSCGGNLWQGIELGYWNTIHFFDNVFQHSLKGIHSQTGPTFTYAFDNIFNDNIFALDLGEMSTNDRMSEVTVRGNLFAHPNEPKEHWENGPLDVWQQFHTGVRTRDAIVDADASRDQCRFTNIFYKLRTGFRLFNSHSTIKANLFRDFYPDEELSVLPGGIGIGAGSFSGGMSYLNQEGWKQTPVVTTFKDVGMGISTSLTNTTIRENKMDVSLQGIRALRPHTTFEVEDNEIYANYSGIYVQNNSAPLMSIQHNSVVLDHDYQTFGIHSAGIEVAYARANSTRGHIRYNTVQLNPGNFGILAINCAEKVVSCNTVRLDALALEYASGIEVRGGSFNRLGENEVFSTFQAASTDEFNAIKLIEAANMNLRVNELSNTNTGLHFSGTCYNLEQRGNAMEDHNVGYYLDGAGITGEQWYAGNQWLGTFSEWGALSDNPNTSPSGYYDHANFFNTDCWPSTINPIIEWFWLVSTQGNCDPPFFTECFLNPETEVELVTNLDTLIVRSDLEFKDFPASRQWQTERYLYRTLANFAGLLQSSSVMDSFWNEMQSSSVRTYHDLSEAIGYYSSPSDTLVTDLQLRDSLIHLLHEDVLPLVEDLLDHPDSTSLMDEIDVYRAEMDSLFAESRVEYMNWRTAAANELKNLLSQVNALPEDNKYASNEKLVMLAEIHAFDSIESLPQSIVGDLKPIASGCILEEGPAGFAAYGLLRELDENHFSFKAYCEDLEGERIAPAVIEENKVGDFSLFPNPTGQEVTVGFDKALTREAVLEVYDMTGKRLLSERIPEGTRQHLLQFDNFSSGQVLIRVHSDQMNASKMLNIQH